MHFRIQQTNLHNIQGGSIKSSPFMTWKHSTLPSGLRRLPMHFRRQQMNLHNIYQLCRPLWDLYQQFFSYVVTLNQLMITQQWTSNQICMYINIWKLSVLRGSIQLDYKISLATNLEIYFEIICVKLIHVQPFHKEIKPYNFSVCKCCESAWSCELKVLIVHKNVEIERKMFTKNVICLYIITGCTYNL